MTEITYTRNGNGYKFVITTAIARVVSDGYPDLEICRQAALEIAIPAIGKDKIKEVFTSETLKA